LRELIFRMVAENKTWGAPRIHGDLKMLRFDISERSVLRWMRKAPRDPEPAKQWSTFLSNHREAIAAMDFFTAPTLTFGVLYCFFVIAHDRRRILHFNVTKHPTSPWVVQQLREAFPYDSAPPYLIFDRSATFNQEVVKTIDSFGMLPKRTSFQSPWQNGVAERFVGNCRRDLLDHVIALNERHMKRLMNEYIRYYHNDRRHLGLNKETPASRPTERRSFPCHGSAASITATTSLRESPPLFALLVSEGKEWNCVHSPVVRCPTCSCSPQPKTKLVLISLLAGQPLLLTAKRRRIRVRIEFWRGTAGERRGRAGRRCVEILQV
jgi:transposase InsO family protein